MSRTADISRRLVPWIPAALVTLLGVVILWPISALQMPLSADHTVHLTRAWLVADTLGEGSLRGWSSVWFYGTPVGELYPILGDYLVIAARVCSLGILDWPQAYAAGFTIAFLAQGWVLIRAGRTMGLGPWPGLVAAGLALLDVGSYREGGWIYTVYYGVWPQALATSLTWLGLAELAAATDTDDDKKRRKGMVLGGLSMGGALLAHPISMLVLAIAGPLVVLTVGIGPVARLRRATVTGLVTGVLGLALAAWWLVPMLGHRGWMASYGWLFQSLDWMLTRALDGQWCQSMPSPVGWTVIAGFVLIAVLGSRPARAFAATAMVLWLMASVDVAWELRLDLVSEGFTHLQYQRFITAAKPGLFLVAGAVIGFAVKLGLHARRKLGGGGGLALAAIGLGAAAGLTAWMAQGHAKEWDDIPLPDDVELSRGLKDIDDDHAALTAWLAEQWSGRERFWRVTVRDQRNIHWFMDIPALADGVPLLKQGFTPGDNFVHKPEEAPAQAQALAQVRYEIRRGQRKSAGVVQTFGQIKVYERRDWQADTVATLAGPGTVEVLEDDVDGGTVRVRVSGTDETSMLVFGIAGFGRWHLYGPDGEIEWFETPIVGDGPDATQAQRRGGELRGGKAHGDDGSEPTLIATGVSDGEYTLSYERWRAVDVLALLLSLVALAGCGALLFRRRIAERIEAPLRRMEVIGHPVVWAALVVGLALFTLVRVNRGRAAEAGQAYGRVLNGDAELRSAKAAFLKTDMLIRPAVVVARRHKKPAAAVFTNVTLGETLTGWGRDRRRPREDEGGGKARDRDRGATGRRRRVDHAVGDELPAQGQPPAARDPDPSAGRHDRRHPRAGYERGEATADAGLRPRSRIGGGGTVNRAQARLLLGAVAAVTALELLAASHVYGDSIDDEDWAAARIAVAALPEGEAVALGTPWLGPRARMEIPALAAAQNVARPDLRGIDRLHVLGLGSDAWSSELDDDLEGGERPAPVSETEIGPFTLTTYALGGGPVLDRLAPRKGRPAIVEVDYRPRACIVATPKADGEPVVLSKARMELGSELRGHVGFSDFNARLRNDAPARVVVRVDGRTVARFLAADEEGWRPFAVRTWPGVADVEVEVTVGVRGQWGKQGLSDRQPRNVCVELRSL